MSNTELTRKYFLIWFNAAGLGHKGYAFEEVWDFYLNKAEPRRLYPEIFASSIKVVGESKAYEVFNQLGNSNPGRLISISDFNDALFDRIDPRRISNFLEYAGEGINAGVSDIAKGISSYGTVGLKTVYVAAVLGVIFFIYLKAKKYGEA